MTTELFNHVSYIDSESHYEFTVMGNGMVIMSECQLDYDQDEDTGECTLNSVIKKEITSFPYTPNEPMKLPSGWLAQHPVTKVLRCHKHRRNARKWMQQSHSDFMQCDGYWDKQQAKELGYQKWVEKKPTNYTSVNDPDFLAWCNEDPRHRKTNPLTPSPIDLEF